MFYAQADWLFRVRILCYLSPRETNEFPSQLGDKSRMLYVNGIAGPLW